MRKQERVDTECWLEPSEEAKIFCPFRLVLRKRKAGKEMVWEFEEEGCEPDHNSLRELCPSQHKTPPWVLDNYPVFLAEMMNILAEMMKILEEDS